MSTRGLLLISDITGYTAYLSESELEHAQDSLSSLLQLLIDHTKSPLIISRLEGDAVISYAPDGSFQQGQTIVEMIERTYLDFRRALEMMVRNTSCTCNACRNIPNLDLKFFVHHGEFVRQRLQSYTELIGSDVNLLHRLTKNSVAEATGLRAYVLYTQAAIEGLEIGDMTGPMIPHVDEVPDFGRMTCYLQDMHAVWERRRDEVSVHVTPESSASVLSLDVPVPQARLWDLITTPEYRALLDGSDSSRVERIESGRIGPGSTYYCAHGTSIVEQTVVDWQPPDEYTFAMDLPLGTYGLNTVRLEPTAEGTRVSLLAGIPQGGSRVKQLILVGFYRLVLRPMLRKNLQALRDRAVEDSASGLGADAPRYEPGTIAQAVKASLREDPGSQGS